MILSMLTETLYQVPCFNPLSFIPKFKSLLELKTIYGRVFKIKSGSVS